MSVHFTLRSARVIAFLAEVLEYSIPRLDVHHWENMLLLNDLRCGQHAHKVALSHVFVVCRS